MNTRTFSLTAAEANALQAAYLHCQNAEAKIRFQAVRLYGLGDGVAQIQEMCLCSLRSLLRWCHLSWVVCHAYANNFVLVQSQIYLHEQVK